MRALSRQEVCLTFLLMYVKGAMTEDDLRSSFFPQFMMYLNSDSHMCECSDCCLSHSQQTVKSIIVSDSSILSDLICYINSDFTFTEDELHHLQNAVTNDQISMNTLQNIKEYYQMLCTSMNALLQ